MKGSQISPSPSPSSSLDRQKTSIVGTPSLQNHGNVDDQSMSVSGLAKAKHVRNNGNSYVAQSASQPNDSDYGNLPR